MSNPLRRIAALNIARWRHSLEGNTDAVLALDREHIDLTAHPKLERFRAALAATVHAVDLLAPRAQQRCRHELASIAPVCVDVLDSSSLRAEHHWCVQAEDLDDVSARLEELTEAWSKLAEVAA